MKFYPPPATMSAITVQLFRLHYYSCLLHNMSYVKNRLMCFVFEAVKMTNTGLYNKRLIYLLLSIHIMFQGSKLQKKLKNVVAKELK